MTFSDDLAMEQTVAIAQGSETVGEYSTHKNSHDNTSTADLINTDAKDASSVVTV
jgi:hypothetical protein